MLSKILKAVMKSKIGPMGFKLMQQQRGGKI